MKILLTNRDLDLNGGATFVANISRYLTERGHEVTVMAGPGRRAGLTRQAGARVISLPLFFDWQIRPLAAWIRRQGFAVVNAHARRQCEISLAAARLANVPFFSTWHGPAPFKRMQPVLDGSRVVQVMNEHNYQYFGQAADAERMHLARLAVPWERYGALAASRPEAKDTFVVTYCSRLSLLKGPLGLAFLRAVDLLAAEIPGLEAWVVGGGKHLRNARRLAAEINARRGRPVCRILGPLCDVPPVLAQSDVVMGAGYVAIEALASGCQVIGAGFGGCWGLVTPENFAAAVAENFGDNCDRESQMTPEAVLPHLRRAYALRAADSRRQVAALAERQFSFEYIGPKIEEPFLRAVGQPTAPIV